MGGSQSAPLNTTYTYRLNLKPVNGIEIPSVEGVIVLSELMNYTPEKYAAYILQRKNVRIALENHTIQSIDIKVDPAILDATPKQVNERMVQLLRSINDELKSRYPLPMKTATLPSGEVYYAPATLPIDKFRFFGVDNKMARTRIVFILSYFQPDEIVGASESEWQN